MESILLQFRIFCLFVIWIRGYSNWFVRIDIGLVIVFVDCTGIRFTHQHQSTSTYYVHLRGIQIWWIMHCAQNDNRFQVEIFPSIFALRKVFSSNRLKLNSFCFRLHSRSIGQSYERTQGFRLLQNNIQMWVQFWAEFHRTPNISGSVHVNRSNRENSEFILVHFLSSAFGNFDSKFHIYRPNNRLNL